MQMRAASPPRPEPPPWPMVEALCVWCRWYPCVCPRTEPCACGGMIVAISDPDAIRDAVVLHNAGDLHRVWRERRESLGDKPLPVGGFSTDNGGSKLLAGALQTP